MEKVVLEFLRVVEVLYMPTSLHQAGCVHSLGTSFAEICHKLSCNETKGLQNTKYTLQTYHFAIA